MYQTDRSSGAHTKAQHLTYPEMQTQRGSPEQAFMQALGTDNFDIISHIDTKFDDVTAK